MRLADIIHCIATDEGFADQMVKNPQATLSRIGASLDAEELFALQKVLKDQSRLEKLMNCENETLMVGLLSWIAPITSKPSTIEQAS